MRVVKDSKYIHIQNTINNSFLKSIKKETSNPFSSNVLRSSINIGIEFEFYIPKTGDTINEKIDYLNDSIDNFIHQTSFYNEDVIIIEDSFEDNKNTDYAYLEKDSTLNNSFGEGFEFVSPKMKLNDVPFYFKSTSEIINGIGYSDYSCGVHFHISSETLQNVDMAKLLTFLHNEENLFEGYIDRNEYTKSLERVFLNSNIDTFNYDVRSQSKRYDIVFLENNHIELRVFGGDNVYQDADNILNKLNTFLSLYRISCIPEMEKDLYKEMMVSNIRAGHHSGEKEDISTVSKLANELKKTSGIEYAEAFEESFKQLEYNSIVPEDIIEEYEHFYTPS